MIRQCLPPLCGLRDLLAPHRESSKIEPPGKPLRPKSLQRQTVNLRELQAVIQKAVDDVERQQRFAQLA